MQKILITQSNTVQAQRIARLIRENYTPVLGSAEELPAFLQERFVQIPSASDSAFAHRLLAFCLDQQIQLVLPLDRDEILQLSATSLLFEEYGIQICCPEAKQLSGLEYAVRPGNADEICLRIHGRLIVGESEGAPKEEGVFVRSDAVPYYRLLVV